MRFIIALVLSIVVAAPAGAGDLFSRTELRCEMRFGGKWDFDQHPPRLMPIPPKQFTIFDIDPASKTARDGNSRLVVIQGQRSIVIADRFTSLVVFKGETIQGFPAVHSTLEYQTAGYCF